MRFFGQEKILTTASIARMNLLLHDMEDAKVIRGDTLRDPKFLDAHGRLRRFDVVIANPPFSLKNWGADAWARDPWSRPTCGVPPTSVADYAWIQHMLASMRPDTGRVGVVMPHGVLFRGGAEGAIRECLLRQDVLEAVIGLPPNLFYSTSIPACLLIFRAVKPAEGRGHVLFIDGAKRFAKGRNQNAMDGQDVEAILAAYETGRDPDGPADGVAVRLVPRDELEANGWDLNITRYLRSNATEVADARTVLEQLRAARTAQREAEDRLHARLAEAGYA